MILADENIILAKIEFIAEFNTICLLLNEINLKNKFNQKPFVK